MENGNQHYVDMIGDPQLIEINRDTIKAILAEAGLDASQAAISAPGTWVMQYYKIQLANGKKYQLKVGANLEWTDAAQINNQVEVSGILKKIIPGQPEIIAYSSDITKHGFLYLLFEHRSGVKLSALLDERRDDLTQLYAQLGEVYGRIHSITNPWAGIWGGSSSQQKYPIHPAAFYSTAELSKGSLKYLLDRNKIDQAMYQKVQSIWKNNLDYLCSRPNSLVHVSAFPWTILFDPGRDYPSIRCLRALGDFMWWDPMYDVANILYPPYFTISDVEREAFLATYHLTIEEKAIHLYMLLNRVLAFTGCFMPPLGRDRVENWINQEIPSLETLVGEIGCNNPPA